jgi:hypothetical protein
MLGTCWNGDVGLAIADERRGAGWQSLMREGSGDGENWIVMGIGVSIRVMREAMSLLC